MKPAAADDVIASATQNLLNYLNDGDENPNLSSKDKWKLEDDILVSLATIQSAVKSFRLWQARIIAGIETFAPETKRVHHDRLRRLLDLIEVLLGKVKQVEGIFRSRGHGNYTVSCAHDLWVSKLDVSLILRENWSPVALISQSFEEVEMDGENADFLERLAAGSP
jgi:hypothetical protein